MLKLSFSTLFLLYSFNVAASPTINFSSPERQTTLLELYTSEGCSSCPPADRWFSTLKNDPRLWKELIPVSFHVDYWNYLGWKDVFSKREYSQRQREYAKYRNLKTVYTPGFLRNGFEWRAWFRNRKLDSILGSKVGRLHITIDNNTLKATFTDNSTAQSHYRLNVAWLGFELSNKIQSGENEGKTLKHDFVCLNTKTYRASKTSKRGDIFNYQWSIDNAIPKNSLPNKSGAAFWVTKGDDPTPIQATGGWL